MDGHATAHIVCSVLAIATLLGAVTATAQSHTPLAQRTQRDADAASAARNEEVVRTLGEVIHEPALNPQNAASRRLVWREDWPRFGFDEAVLTFGVGALLLTAELLPTASYEPNWRGGLLFDDGVRSGLRLQSQEQRASASVASDVLMGINIAFPFLIDAFGVAGFGNWNWDAALQMGLIGLESYVLALIVWRVTTLLARRERPVDSACGAPGEPTYCAGRQTSQAFFSNQTVNAFTGASLTCIQHAHMPLFGGGAGDTSACVGAVAVASTVGLLRVLSDFEYLSDVLVGAAVGFVAGYVVPWVLHYQGGALPPLAPPTIRDDLEQEPSDLEPAPQEAHTAIVPVPQPLGVDGYGLGVLGVF